MAWLDHGGTEGSHTLTFCVHYLIPQQAINGKAIHKDMDNGPHSLCKKKKVLGLKKTLH